MLWGSLTTHLKIVKSLRSIDVDQKMQNLNIGKTHSPACDRNWKPILNILKKIITNEHNNLLEIGSGTGQHAVYIAPYFPSLKWFTSDVAINHLRIKLWLDSTDVDNVLPPIEFEIGRNNFPAGDFDIVFTANTFHIMSLDNVKLLAIMCGKNLKQGALFIVYGAFNYNGCYTSESNKDFDESLRLMNPHSGIREFEEIDKIMTENGFKLLNDCEMPANNRLLIFEKVQIS